MSLYNKYRPTTFEGMKGNFTSIQRHLQKKDHNHVLLFHGTSGVGKTTCGRIVAAEVGATERDTKEINCSSNNGIDFIRSLSDDILLAPDGKHKVYILDEFQQVSPQAQNAFLKELEDVPEHVYFILCTSEPRKIIRAIHTRAVVFNFPPLTVEAIYDIIREIAIAEEFTVSKEIKYEIAEFADGSARFAINELERVVQFEEADRKRALKRESEPEELIDICRIYFDEGSTWKEVAKSFGLLKEQKADSETIRRTLLGYGTALLLGNKPDIALRLMKPLIQNTFDSGLPGLAVSLRQGWETIHTGGF